LCLGEAGSLFYIILSGEVVIKIPTVLEKELTVEELFLFLLENEAEIDWEGLKGSLYNLLASGSILEFKGQEDLNRLVDKLHDSVKYHLAKLARGKQDPAMSMSEKILHRLSEKKMFIPIHVHNIIGGGSDKRVGHVKIKFMKEVARLSPG
jgi:hypothetical protein